MGLASLVKLVVECDIAAMKAISLIVGMVAMTLFYLTRMWHGLLQTIQSDYGGKGVAVAFAVVFAGAFLLAHLASSLLLRQVRKKVDRDSHFLKEKQEQSGIEDILASLSIWQRQFLLRFIHEGRAQIQDWEIGQYQAVWGPEVEVLVRKGIVFDHGGIYEIAHRFREYMRRS